MFLTGYSAPLKIGNKFYCDHCKTAVSKSTFYEHRGLYVSPCSKNNSNSGSLEDGTEGVSISESNSEEPDPEPLSFVPEMEEEDLQFFENVDAEIDETMLSESSSSIHPVVGQLDEEAHSSAGEEHEEVITVAINCLSVH